ncbi:MAG: nitroreductase family protein [Nitrososphaeraceae archaeon]|jgi:nitroreductase|nr:nitroreductase family protein [Nitrososphaeraceae archaeon]MDW0190038.1 nitroreductase family protein [Nitrososphaeraceae archaeon]MDW0230289.1 nitroreductase family protein [Nitrososphaeraceae archaeon]MDW0322029.1 nitroreductase family protein [Nitrososphaeraceae archaeon]MDW0335966.1 nitroreductase family protein [Nitrososphaeraceae archaeon]
MDAFESVATKLDIREFSPKQVPPEIKSNVLEAARLTGTGLNTQHWRFILVENKENLKKLAEDSTSGNWVANCKFAVIILTNPKYGFHLIDAGRVIQNMQVTAWNYGVGSGIFTGIKEEIFRRDFGIPKELNVAAVIGFGYPLKKLTGKRKDRLPLTVLVHKEKYSNTNQR